MDRDLNQIGATVIVVGSILFLVAAFLPVSYRVFPQPSPVQKLEAINADPGQWVTAQLLFALGTVVTVIGVGLYAYYVHREPYAPFAWGSVALLTVGAAPWLWQLYARTVDAASFTEGLFSIWPYLFYFLTTEAGLALFGVALLSSPLPSWVGGVVISTMVVLAILTVIFRDMPPFAFYVITLLTGVMLYRQTP